MLERGSGRQHPSLVMLNCNFVCSCVATVGLEEGNPGSGVGGDNAIR